MSITTADIKQLREITGAGILDCKKALQETDGNLDQAVEFLRKKGLAAASKKAGREANDGLVNAQISPDGEVGVMVEVNCETDFVARTEDFQNFVDSLCEQLLTQPELDSAETLLAAPHIDNEDQTVAQALKEVIAKLGENIVVRRVTTFERQEQALLDSYIHIGGRVGVLVEVGGDDPNDEQFAKLVHDLALHIAAAAPAYLTEEEVAPEDVAREKDVYRAQAAQEDKPDHIKERIIEGKLKKWYQEVVLLNQQFVKDSDLTITQLLKQQSKALGTDIQIRRFARFELGEEA